MVGYVLELCGRIIDDLELCRRIGTGWIRLTGGDVGDLDLGGRGRGDVVSRGSLDVLSGGGFDIFS